MENSLVISVRLPESLVKELDELAKSSRWFKRNAIILRALEAFIYAADYRTQIKILHWWRHGGNIANLNFELVDEK